MPDSSAPSPAVLDPAALGGDGRAPNASANASAVGPAGPSAVLRATRLALAGARQEATRARQQSLRLCARAEDASRVAAAYREFVNSQRALWQHWHRTWAALAAPNGPRFLRVCAYCGEAVLERAAPGASGASGAWGPVPPWVSDRLGTGALGLVASHGACPTCAEARLGG